MYTYSNDKCYFSFEIINVIDRKHFEKCLMVGEMTMFPAGRSQTRFTIEFFFLLLFIIFPFLILFVFVSFLTWFGFVFVL